MGGVSSVQSPSATVVVEVLSDKLCEGRSCPDLIAGPDAAAGDAKSSALTEDEQTEEELFSCETTSASDSGCGDSGDAPSRGSVTPPPSPPWRSAPLPTLGLPPGAVGVRHTFIHISEPRDVDAYSARRAQSAPPCLARHLRDRVATPPGDVERKEEFVWTREVAEFVPRGFSGDSVPASPVAWPPTDRTPQSLSGSEAERNWLSQLRRLGVAPIEPHRPEEIIPARPRWGSSPCTLLGTFGPEASAHGWHQWQTIPGGVGRTPPGSWHAPGVGGPFWIAAPR